MPRLASNSARRGPTPLRYITSVEGVIRIDYSWGPPDVFVKLIREAHCSVGLQADTLGSSRCPPEHLAEKLKKLSFRGTLRAEESLFLFAFKPRGIPHFVRNDNQKDFFRNL